MTLANRVRELTLTTGTGDITLGGALAAHITFADAFTVGDTVTYVIEDGDNYEIGSGTLMAADTLVRTVVGETLVDGVYDKTSPTAITLSGNALVFCAVTAEFLLDPNMLADVISEVTPGAGVLVDGALIKDGAFTAQGAGTVFDAHVVQDTMAGTIPVHWQKQATKFILQAGGVGDLAVFDLANLDTTFSGDLSLNNNSLFSLDSIIRGTGADSLIVTGGGSTSLGALIQMYGQTHATRADDMDFRASGATWLSWDNSAGSIQVGGDVALSSDIFGTNATDGVVYGGGTSNIVGANILMRAEGHADANDMYFRYGTNLWAEYDASASLFDVKTTMQVGGDISIGGTDIFRDINTGVIQLNGSNANDTGGAFVGYGSAHITNADDYVLKSGSTWTQHYDASLGKLLVNVEAQFSGSVIRNGGGTGFTQVNDLSNTIFTVGTTSDAGLMKLNEANGTEFLRADALAKFLTVSGAATFSGKITGDDGATITDSVNSSSNAVLELLSSGNGDVNFLKMGANTWVGNEPSGSLFLASNAYNNSGTNTYRGGADTTTGCSILELLKPALLTDVAFQFVTSSADVVTDADITEVAVLRILQNGSAFLDSSETTALTITHTDGAAVWQKFANSTSDYFVGYEETQGFVLSPDTSAIHLAINATTGNATFGGDIIASGGAGGFYNSVDTLATYVSGGTATNVGANVGFFGATHATNANDIIFRNGPTTISQWDASASVWNYQGNNLVGVGDITMSGDAIYRDIATGSFILTGGSTSSLGARTVMYGEGHATRANDLDFFSGATRTLAYDDSLNTWDFQGNNIIGVNTLTISDDAGIFRSIDTGTLTLAGGNGSATGGYIALRGQNHATQANDIFLGVGAAPKLHYDDSIGTWDFQNLALTEVGEIQLSGSRIIRNGPSGVMQISGGSHQDAGTNFLLYGESHATNSNDFILRAGTSNVLFYDDSAGFFSFQSKDISSVNSLSLNSDDGVFKSTTNSTLTIAGGSDGNLGGNVVFFGESHATQAKDIAFRSDTTNRLVWDNSASHWTFQSNPISGVGNITMTGNLLHIASSADTQTTLRLEANRSGAGQNLGSTEYYWNNTRVASIFARTGSDTINRDDADLAFTTSSGAGAVIRLLIESTGTADFQGNDLIGVGSLSLNSDDGIFKSTTNSTLILAGGNAANDGAFLALRGSSHATEANDIYLGVNGGTRLKWDESADNWSFTNKSIVDVGDIARGVIGDALGLAGGSTSVLGGRLILYGESHGTQAGDIELASGASTKLQWNDSTLRWEFGTNIISGVSDMRRGGDGTGLMYLSGGSNLNNGGNIVMYGESHATQANDIIFRNGTATVLQWDASNDFWNFQGKSIVQPTSIYQGTTTGSLIVSGGSTTGLGNNIVHYAESHASRPNGMLIRADTTAILEWHNGSGEWRYQSNDITGVNSIELESLIQLNEITAEPTTPTDGMIVYADGTTWNPGGGEGVYARVAGAWAKMT